MGGYKIDWNRGGDGDMLQKATEIVSKQSERITIWIEIVQCCRLKFFAVWNQNCVKSRIIILSIDCIDDSDRRRDRKQTKN